MRCLGTRGGLCVAAAVKVRDAPQLRHCWAVGATGWVTNNPNTLVAGVHRHLRCNALPLTFGVLGTALTSCSRNLWGGAVCHPDVARQQKHSDHSASHNVRFEAASPFLLLSRQRQKLLTAIVHPTILLEARQQSLPFCDSAEGLEFFDRLVFRQAADA